MVPSSLFFTVMVTSPYGRSPELRYSKICPEIVPRFTTPSGRVALISEIVPAESEPGAGLALMSPISQIGRDEKLGEGDGTGAGFATGIQGCPANACQRLTI